MINLRRSKERGFAEHGWLKSQHSFSFANYHDPKHMGFGPLRVINEDWVAGGMGFQTHGHRDMEIITYVMEGALAHKDSMGNNAVILPGEVQKMTAGSGIMHSEFNHLKDQTTHLYQIWIEPNEFGLTPSYWQKSFELELNKEKFILVASRDGRDESILIHQDADLYLSRLKAGESFEFLNKGNRKAWIQMLRGKLMINSIELETGDALSVEEKESLILTAPEECEFMLFDLP